MFISLLLFVSLSTVFIFTFIPGLWNNQHFHFIPVKLICEETNKLLSPHFDFQIKTNVVFYTYKAILLYRHIVCINYLTLSYFLLKILKQGFLLEAKLKYCKMLREIHYSCERSILAYS